MDETAIVKRIIKAYLYFKGEASTSMICNHIEKTGYGLRKTYSTRYLSANIRKWSSNGKSGSWFRVTFEQRGRERWWRLE